jgi:sulfatase maturation enzyme AslB (radical SAM superfamily)
VNETITIDWNFGNSCDLKCSYCHKELHDGANPFPILDKFGPAFAHLIEQARDFSRVNLEFSGGEPTQSPALQHIVLANQDERIKFKINSNAQAPADWWQCIAHKLYEATLTYHRATDFDHFLTVSKAINEFIRPKIYIPLTPDTWDLTPYRTLKDLGYEVHLQLLYSNFTRGNDAYLKYTQEQWDEYYTEKGIDIHNIAQVEQTVEFKRVNHLNNYYGHMCWAGYNQIIIDNFGDVYRGWCKAGNSLGNVFRHDVVLDKQPAPCPKTQCKNGFDLQAHKSKGSWGFA